MMPGCQQQVKVPQKFKEWNSADGSFAMEYPATWIPKGGVNKNHGSAHLKVERGGVSIRVDASFEQAIMGDLMNMGGPLGGIDMGELPEASRPEAMLHQKNLEYYTENYRNYEELPAETRRIPMGSARVAEFTASLME